MKHKMYWNHSHSLYSILLFYLHLNTLKAIRADYCISFPLPFLVFLTFFKIFPCGKRRAETNQIVKKNISVNTLKSQSDQYCGWNHVREPSPECVCPWICTSIYIPKYCRREHANAFVDVWCMCGWFLPLHYGSNFQIQNVLCPHCVHDTKQHAML